MKRLPVVLLAVTVALLAVTVAFVTVRAGGAAQDSGVRYLNNPGRDDNNPYSNLVDTGGVVYLAGAIGVDPETGMPPASIEEEIRLVLDGMASRLESVDLTMDDLVEVRVYCPDLDLYDQFNAIYRTYFTDHFPARAFVGSGPLLRGGHFEITGTAVRR